MRGLDDVFDREAEFFEENSRRRGVAEAGHADESASVAEIFRPARFDAQFDAHARFHRRRQDGVAIFLRLRVEEFEARSADDARLHALRRKRVLRRQAKTDFATRRDEDDVGSSFAVAQDVSAFGDSAGGRIFCAVDGRQILAREDYDRRGLLHLHRGSVRFRDFVRVRWSKDRDVRHGAERREMFDRLVRRAVFADADRIVREDEKGRRLHERGETNHRAQEIREDEEGGAISSQPREGQAVRDRAHRVFTNAKVHVAPRDPRTESSVGRILELRVVRRTQVCGTADEPRESRR